MPKWIDVLLCCVNDTAQQATANLNAEQIGAFCNNRLSSKRFGSMLALAEEGEISLRP